LPGTRQRAFLTAVIERIGVGANQIDIARVGSAQRSISLSHYYCRA
jgi:hypothetical protein